MKYKSGLSNRQSHRTSSIIGVILCGRPDLIRGALTLPNSRNLDRILIIAHLLQSTAFAICEIVSSLLAIISRINTRIDLARLGAMVRCHQWECQPRSPGENWESGREALRLQLLVLQVMNMLSGIMIVR